MSETRQCVVCDHRGIAMESHHVYPVCYGGPQDGVQVILCGNCHSNVHRTAENLCAKKPKKEDYFAPGLLSRQITKELVAIVIRAKRTHVNGHNPTQKRKVRLEMPNQLLTDLHKCKMDAGFTNLEDFILKVLVDHVNRRL